MEEFFIYFLDTSPYQITCFVKIFSHLWTVFPLWWSPLKHLSFWFWGSPFFPPVVLSAFGIIFKESKVIRFTLVFSPKNYMVLVLIYGSMTILRCFSYMVWNRNPTSSLCGYLSVPAPFNSLALTLVKNQLTVSIMIYSGLSTQFHFIFWSICLFLYEYHTVLITALL